MSKSKELGILFHAYNLENHFSSTKISRLFQCYLESQSGNSTEDQRSLSRERFLHLIGIPGDKAWQEARMEIDQALDIGIEVITFLDKNYPVNLLTISDPPLVLFVSGKTRFEKAITHSSMLWGIVGARNPSRYGVSICEKLSCELASEGCTVVSGLAYGIDKSAHEGALKAFNTNFCPTVAVLGSGLLEIYPESHKGLVNEIIESGGFIISEYGLRMTPRTFLFPRRNRIISGLSKGVIVIEAKKRSGSLITARLALEQGRDLYCLPGPIDSELSEGVNLLIKDGAGVITSIEDFILSILPEVQTKRKSLNQSVSKVSLNTLQKDIINELKKTDLTLDDLLRRFEIESSNIQAELIKLEISGMILKDGAFYRLAD